MDETPRRLAAFIVAEHYTTLVSTFQGELRSANEQQTKTLNLDYLFENIYF